MVCNLQRGVIRTVLESGIARENSGDVEDDGGLFECKRVLLCRLVGERIEPITAQDFSQYECQG